MDQMIFPGVPHHVVHRGRRGNRIFFGDEDYSTYFQTATKLLRLHDVAVWTYCFMPDHIHLIVVPEDERSVGKALLEAATQYGLYLNSRTDRTEAPFQDTFAAHALDEQYLIACTRYVEINPVKREYVQLPEQWPWSSAAAHIKEKDNELVTVLPLLSRVKRSWSDFLGESIPEEEAELFYSHEKSGKPLGSPSFIKGLKEMTNPTP